MTAEICVLRPQDRVLHDAAPVAVIYRDMGAQAAEQIVTRALGELALTMSGLADRVAARDMSDLARQLRRLQRMSEQLGLVSFAAVAGDARIVLERSDGTAFPAVWARLLRIAKLVLAPGCGLLDQSV